MSDEDNKKTGNGLEIESLNADELDIEELEQRIELAPASPDPFGWICGVDCGSLSCVGDGVIVIVDET